MSKPVDLKTVKIFEPLKKKPSFENKIFNTINADEVYDVLSKHSVSYTHLTLPTTEAV